MPTYDQICEHLRNINLNGYRVATGGSGSTYVTLAPENYRDLHIVLWHNSNKNSINIYFEVVNATAKKNTEIQLYCDKNEWKASRRDEEVETYKKAYQNYSLDSFGSLEAFEKAITDAQDTINPEFKEMEKIIDETNSTSSPKKSRKNAQNTLSTYVPRQIIYFGAPGTSKSYTLNKDAEKIANQERVTFYPGYSYQQFVGTYKPFMDGDKISYKFVPGPLLRLLEKALKAEKAEKAKPQNENKAEAPAAETSTENQENGKEEKEPEKFLLIVEELNRAEAAAVFGDLFQLLDRNSDGSSEYPISVSEDLKQYLCRKDGVWENEPEDTQKKLSFPSNFYIWATMNSADQGVFPLDTAFKRRWDFKYFGINDAANELENNVQKFWNNLRTTINDALKEKLNLNEDKLLGPFFMKVEEDIEEPTFWQRFRSKVLLYLYEDAARLKRSQIFKVKTYSDIYNAFEKINSMETLQEKWNDVFFSERKPAGNYPWAKAETEGDTSSASQADDNEPDGEPVTDNSDGMTDEQ